MEQELNQPTIPDTSLPSTPADETLYHVDEREDEEGQIDYEDPLDPLLNDPDALVECKYITGPAGTGKTYQMRKAIEADPKFGILCATTGVAAVNLGAVTVNSIFKYKDVDDLTDQFVNGRLTRTFSMLSKIYRNVVVDETSMMGAPTLDILHQGALQANQRGYKIGIILTGDFCQLPPIKAPWAFEAQAWDYFAKNVTKLDKIYRQSDEQFLEALKAARAGEGKRAVEILRPMANWKVMVDNNFEGTTILSTNDEVERYNTARYLKVVGREVMIRAKRWGKQLKEWEKNIPDALRMKKGAYVMILANAATIPGMPLEYANGDCGWVEDFGGDSVLVRLKRNNMKVWVNAVTRQNESKERPKEGTAIWAGIGPHFDEPFYDKKRKRWVYGAVTYSPIRLAYATTVHKSQGLTLDSVQIDLRHAFFGSPNMAYVALSRVKTPQGLTVVGTPELLDRRIKIAPEVKPWI